MPGFREHAITRASFEQIDQEIGQHSFSPAEYAVVRRVIHTTADFEYLHLLQFSHQPFAAVAQALGARAPILADVSMVAAGISGVVQRTWQVPVVTAVHQSVTLSELPFFSAAIPQTRSALGMQQCAQTYPRAIVAIGNAPTALLALCEGVERGFFRPALVIGAPVGFVNVVESKQALARTSIPHILVTGRKGGSAVAAAILNALMIWAWEQLP